MNDSNNAVSEKAMKSMENEENDKKSQTEKDEGNLDKAKASATIETKNPE